MKQLSILLLLITFRLVTFGQVYQEMPQYGYRANRMAFDSTLQIPTFCGVPTLRSVVKANKNGAIAFDSCNNKLYKYNPKTLTWSEIGGSAGGDFWNTSGSTILGGADTIKSDGILVFGGKDEDMAKFQLQANDIDISTSGGPNGLRILGLNTLTDTTEYKPLMIGSSGRIEKSASWFGGVGGVGGLPIGGSAGQILTKVDSTNYNATWQDNYADWTSQVKHIVKNNGTGLISKGTAVYVTSSNGTNILVGKASNTSEGTSSKTMGLMQSDITTTGGTSTGFVITEGLLGGLNTQGATAGDPVWLGVNGALIYGLVNKPYAPAHLVFIGIVTKVSAGNGEIFVKVQNGFEFKEIHDVDLITNTPVHNDIVVYDTATTLWKNKSIFSVVDTTNKIATKTNLNNFVNLTTAQTIAGTKTFSSNIKIPSVGQQLILQVNSDGSVSGMPTSIYPSVGELTNVKGTTSAIQTQLNNKVNISDTSNMLSNYRTAINAKLNASDTASLSNRIEKEVSNLDFLQLLSYGIKAEPYGITLANMSGQQGLTTNRFYLYPFNWNVSDTLRGIAFFNRSPFTNVAVNYNGIAIYTLSGGTLTRVFQTANDGTFWNSTINTWSTKSLTPTFLTKGLYFIGYQFSGSGTPTIGAGDPLVIASTQSPSDPPSAVNPNGIKFSTFIANTTANAPSSIAMSATTAVVNVPYFLFY